MTTFIDIMQSVKEKKTSEMELVESVETIEAIRKLRSEEWAEVFDMSHDQFTALHVVMQDGLTHISYVLELEKKPKRLANDVEKADATPSPGSKGFAAFLEEEIQNSISTDRTCFRNGASARVSYCPVLSGTTHHSSTR